MKKKEYYSEEMEKSIDDKMRAQFSGSNLQYFMQPLNHSTANHLADEIKAAVAGVSQNVLARLDTLAEENNAANEEDKAE